MNESKKLHIIVNVDWFFLSHRKEIALAAKKAGYDVTIVAGNTGKKNEIEALGLKFINLPMDRTGTNIWAELKTFAFLLSLYRRKKVDIVHHVGLKVVLIGGLAAKLARVTGIVNAISGLGITFSKENSKSVSTRLFIHILRFSHRCKQTKVIFQNQDDRSIFLNNRIIQENQSEFIKGSGINLSKFVYTPEPATGKLKVILTARMIIEKGVMELVRAAEILRENYQTKVQFILCGGIDINPKAMKEEKLKKLCDGKYIVWLGQRNDIKELLQNCHIVAFPSYYKEGLPKSLIEACAIGRPIITTNSVGCKDVVTDNYNGFLIPIKNSEILAKCLKQLIDNKELRIEFGKNSRLIAERDFAIENVIERHLRIYKQFTVTE